MIDNIETASLDDLMARAAAKRDAAHGGLVSYSRKVFIPLTHLCRDVCHYCTFAKRPRAGKAAFMSADDVLAVRKFAERAGSEGFQRGADGVDVADFLGIQVADGEPAAGARDTRGNVPAGRRLRNALSKVCCVPSASMLTSAPPPVRRFTSATTSTLR